MKGRPKGTKEKTLQAVEAVQLDTLPPSVKTALEACSPLQQSFVTMFCSPAPYGARGNATLAAKMAGVSGTYSKIASMASQWRREPQVRKAIEAWMGAFAKTGIELTQELADMSECNLGPFLTKDKKGNRVLKLPADDAEWEAHKHWIKAVDVDRSGRVTRLVLHDALAAKREMAKILKLYIDQPPINLNVILSRMSDDELVAQWKKARLDAPDNKGDQPTGALH